MIRNKNITLSGLGFYVKTVEFLQQKWGLVDQKEHHVAPWFINDNSYILDSLTFKNERDTLFALRSNGFPKFEYSVKLKDRMAPPKGAYGKK